MIGRMMAGVGTRLHDTRVNDSRLMPRRHGCVYVLTRRDGVLVAERNADAALFELLYLSRQAQYRCIASCQTEKDGNGKRGSAKAPTAMPQ